MTAATLALGDDRPALRQALALSASMLLHLLFVIVMFALAQYEVSEAPIEIALFEGPEGPASPPPGAKSAEPGRIAPPVPAPKAPSAPKAKVAEGPRHAAARPVPIDRPVEEQGLLAALKSTRLASTTRAFEGVDSSVRLRQSPTESQAPSTAALGTPRAKADVAVDSNALAAGPAVSGSLASSVGSVALPGPGGAGTGWSTSAGGTGSGVGGAGRGGFSVSGAGAGGAGRSYASIWEWTQRYLAGLRWAYNNELRVEPVLRGVLVVRYEILTTGSIGAVTMVSSQLHDPRLEQDVTNQIRGWRYPPEPSGNVVVTWPFSFLPPS